MAKDRTPPPPESARVSHFEVARELGYVKPAPTHDEIAKRAYELYLARAGGPGSALEDWLRAERELTRGP